MFTLNGDLNVPLTSTCKGLVRNPTQSREPEERIAPAIEKRHAARAVAVHRLSTMCVILPEYTENSTEIVLMCEMRARHTRMNRQRRHIVDSNLTHTRPAFLRYRPDSRQTKTPLCRPERATARDTAHE